MEKLRADGLTAISAVGGSVGKQVKRNPVVVGLLIVGTLGLIYTVVNRKTVFA